MLSILIPVYQYDVQALVRDLLEQARQLDCSWEIICLDDGSDTFWKDRNRALGGFPGVRYEESPANLGRAGVRNRLTAMARFPYLQFMDCDSGVVRPDFLAKYVAALRPETVLCGGRVYASDRPAEEAYALHWLYGKAREEVPAVRRSEHPHHAFMTNNFVVPAAVMQRIPFDERLTQYGHEDTLFGLELREAGIAIEHLDNPLQHIGLERSDDFLRKAEQAVANLAFLRKQKTSIETRLTKTYDDLERRGFLDFTRFGLWLLARCFRRNILSAHPDLKVFDAYRLWLFIEAMRGKIDAEVG